MLLEEIRKELEGLVDPAELRKRIEWEKQYRQKPRLYGIPAALVRKVSCKQFPESEGVQQA